MKISRVVFMGTPDFAVGTLQALIRSEYEVVAVYTQPDKPQGRKAILTPTAVKACALEAGLPVYQPEKIREPEVIDQLEALKPDVIVVAAYGQIIPKRILELAPFGCINVHASLLPAYRGAAPIQWAVIDGLKETGVTTMQMGTGLDTGDMIETCVVPLDPEETGGSLFDKMTEAGAQLLIHTLQSLEEGRATWTPQPEESPTAYAAMLTKQDGLVDWSLPAEKIECRVRGLNPWPCAYTRLNGKQLKLWKCAVCPQPEGERPAAGTVVAVDKKTLLVQTGEGLLEIRELQLEGKKRMETEAFLRGQNIEKGTLLG
ncbi:MAG: methionyl-tRNA formyltransferase [Lachnospiraceae bacterium]|nr:methionyl-tRNA formyltransferase [Lachnospiraceae bacterium]